MTALVLLASMMWQQSTAKFEVKAPSTLKGQLIDVVGATIPNAQLVLKKHGKVVRKLTTGKDGSYDFGQLAPGKYEISDDVRAWCAPAVSCSEGVCSLKSKKSDCWITPIDAASH
jgi:hypothetical protein